MYKTTIFKIFILLSLSLLNAKENSDSTAKVLIHNEDCFSNASIQKGVRDSFIEYFSDDCIGFHPLPTNGKEFQKKRPASKGILTWHASVVELSRSGNFGWTTGPWEYRKEKLSDEPVAHGHFISVWKIQADSTWKVILDVGNSYSKSEVKKENITIINKKTNLHSDTSRSVLLEREKRFEQQCAADGITKAFLSNASDNVRLYRENIFPVTNQKEMENVLVTQKEQYSFTTSDVQISSGGDLGFVYGKAISTKNDTCGFMRIWRNEDEWKIAVDILVPGK